MLVGFGALIVALFIFSQNGAYDLRVDGEIYAAQVESFASGNVFNASPDVMLRIFKPLYAFVGGMILHVGNPYAFILILNILFYIALAFLAFEFLQMLTFKEEYACIGALWIIAAYPMLKYGLAIDTDISGWFFSLLTLFVGLKALQKNSLKLLGTASVIAFLGGISKESGVIGLISLCLFVIWRSRYETVKDMTKKLGALILPAAVLYGILIVAIVGRAPTFIEWYRKNITEYGASYHSLFGLISVEISTFGILWIFAGITLYQIYKKRIRFAYKDLLVTNCIAAAIMLLWPIFISRIFFIEFIWMIPLALLGLEVLKAKFPHKFSLALFALLPIIFNVILFAISGGGSLFKLI